MRASFLALVLVSVAIGRSQAVLTARKCAASLPVGRRSFSTVFDRNDTIYFIYAYDETFPNTEIAEFRITPDTAARVGTLPIPLQVSSAAVDSEGNLYHFGGTRYGVNQTNDYVTDIFQYSPATRQIRKVGDLDVAWQGFQRSTLQTDKDSVIVFSPYGGNRSSFHIALNENFTSIDFDGMRLTNQVPTVAWDGDDLIYYLDGGAISKYSVSGQNSSYIRFGTNLFSVTMLWASGKLWILDAADTNGLIEVDTETGNFTTHSVIDYPAGVRGMGIAYVEETNRIYFGGGYLFPGYTTDIFYIDLDELDESPPTGTPGPTSTSTPPPVSCSNFQCPPSIDGNYPDPSDCSKYVSCINGTPYCFSCPPPLYYDGAMDRCDFPQFVDCGSRPTP